jgi:predicted ABC-type sugar transport system permease subunit
VFGAHVAAFIIGAIEAGTVAVGQSGFWMQLTYGFLIVLSVAIQINVRKRLK